VDLISFIRDGRKRLGMVAVLFPVFALQMLALLWILRSRAGAWLRCFFLGTLFPALGFLIFIRFVFVRGDHFQYLASIGR